MKQREIKFRFWLGHTQKMTHEHSLIDISHLHWDFTEDIIPLQFTGLTDKNGKEIYEGDVLMYIATNMSSMEVCFINGCFVGIGPFNELPLIDYINALDFQSVEVIGNVFENPELT